jgi:hypothetical protein
MRFLLLFLLPITSGVTFAQDYPTRPVRMIEPFGAGGTCLIAAFERLSRVVCNLRQMTRGRHSP